MNLFGPVSCPVSLHSSLTKWAWRPWVSVSPKGGTDGPFPNYQLKWTGRTGPFVVNQSSAPDLRWVFRHLWDVASHLHPPGITYHLLSLDYLIQHNCALWSLWLPSLPSMTFGNLFCPVHTNVCLVLYCLPQVTFEEKVCNFVNIEQGQ